MHRTLRPFEILEPRSLPKAVDQLTLHGTKAKVMAGGMDLVSRMRRWQINPKYLVSLQNIPDLDYLNIGEDGSLKIGPLTTIRSIEQSPVIKKSWRLLYDGAHQIASVQVKTMGTLIGNLCVATPASDLAPILYVLDARLKIIGPQMGKTVSIKDFFIPVCRCVLDYNHIVTELTVPALLKNTGTSFQKLGHTHASIAKINAAVAITADNGVCQEARIALGAVAPTVIRVPRAETILKDQKLSAKLIAQASEAAAAEATPITDVRSTADYRKEMVAVLVKRAIEKAEEDLRVKVS